MMLFLFLFMTMPLSAQRVWVFLGEKPVPASVAPADLGISERALQRRAKSLSPANCIDEHDYPVSEEEIRRIEGVGVRIRTISRWLNAVSVEATPEQLQQIRQLPNVRAIRAVARSKRDPLVVPADVSPFYRRDGSMPDPSSDAWYGTSKKQLSSVNVLPLHAAGITGKGVIIGMLDDGFNNHRTHEALAPIHVVGEYDFVQRDANTSIAYGEYADQGNHGAATLSLIGGYAPGKLIGAAYGASFYLAKTEIDSVEVQADEDNFVEGLEWLERQGVDIVSASLGYDDLDPSGIASRGNGVYDDGDIVYEMKDGKTAIPTRAVQIAVRKGVLFVVSAGNEGWAKKDTIISRDSVGNITRILWGKKEGTGSITSPADADSILAVGALLSTGFLTGFSSTGPTADGRIKPDVVAQGSLITAVDGRGTKGYILSGSGTSYAAPLAAGAAALILSAHPELTAMQVREAILATARFVNDTLSKGVNPNNYYGYGAVDAFEAALYFGPVVSQTPTIVKKDSGYSISVVILSKTPLLSDSLFFFYRFDALSSYTSVPLTRVVDSLYTCFVPSATERIPEGYFLVKETSGKIIQRTLGTSSQPVEFIVYQNYPNPFNSTTTILFDIAQPSEGEVAIFNILGQRVRTLYSGTFPAGRIARQWDGTNEYGVRVSSGVYFYRIKIPTQVVTKKMLYLR